MAAIRDKEACAAGQGAQTPDAGPPAGNMSRAPDKASAAAVLAVELLKADLDAVRKLEHWGSGLFLTIIAAVTQQLVGWHGTPWLDVLPAVLGVVAFLFLRLVNFYTHMFSAQLWKRFAHEEYRKGLGGYLGYALAGMPLAGGVLASCAFWWYWVGRASWMCTPPVIILVGLGVLVGTVAGTGCFRKILFEGCKRALLRRKPLLAPERATARRPES